MNTGSAIIKAPDDAKKGQTIKVIFVIIHPMETGTSKNSAGETIPAHHITTIKVSFAGKMISEMNVGPGVSKNPTFSITLKPEKTGDLKIDYVDNKGGSWSKSKQIKVS